MYAPQSTCFAPYFYRVHPDKTVDSICTRCFEASDVAGNFNQLRDWESAHHCEELTASVSPGMTLQV